MAFYQRLKDLKEDADLTQREAAELIGVSMNHYGKYERGETDIPLEKAVILADYYEVTLDYLAGRSNIKNHVSNKAQLILLAELFSQLNAENKARIEERMLEMLEKQK